VAYQKLVDKKFWLLTLLKISKKFKNLTEMQNLHYMPEKKHGSNNINFSIKSFFQAYNNALQSKAISFEYPVLKSLLVHDLLQCLLKESRISGYQFLEEQQRINVFLSYDLAQKMPLISKFTFYSSHGRTQIASLSMLQSFNKQNPRSLTLIGTKMGILTLKECLQRKCGGQLLVTTT